MPTSRDVAFTAAGLAEFAATAAGHVGDEGVPGLVALVACGEQVHVEALGVRSLGGPPMSRDTLFRIASTTKPITAATALALVDDGRLALDEPVDRLLPELASRRVLRRVDGPLDDTVPARRPITPRDLFTFTFGFGIVSEMFGTPEPWPVKVAADAIDRSMLGPPDRSRDPDPDEWLRGFGTLPLLAQPGERWTYNTAAIVLGLLVERAAGAPLAEVMRARVLEPLGMHETGFWAAEPARLATAYRRGADGLVAWDGPDGRWSGPRRFCDGAAGLVSTADDLLRFARMLLAGGAPVLSTAAVRGMTTDQLTAGQKARGGLGPRFFDRRGWGFGQAVLASGAYGWDGGLGTSWLVDPHRDLTVIVLTQREFESAEPPRAHRELQAAAYAALGSPGEDTPTRG